MLKNVPLDIPILDLANDSRYEDVIGSVIRLSRSSSWKVTGLPVIFVFIEVIMGILCSKSSKSFKVLFWGKKRWL